MLENQPNNSKFPLQWLKDAFREKFHLPERRRLEVMGRLAAVGLVALASLLAVKSALGSGEGERANLTPLSPQAITISGTQIIYERESKANQTLSTPSPEPVRVEETHISNSLKIPLPPSVAQGSVFSAWVERYGCGAGENGETWAEVFSWIHYKGTVIATQTHILYTTDWAEGVRHVDDLNAPPDWEILWGSGTGMDPSFPTRALPDRWSVTQEATDKVSGDSLLWQESWLYCPYVQSTNTIIGIPTWFTVTEANASTFRMKIGSENFTNPAGVFSYTFSQTGSVPVNVIAEGLGKRVSRAVNLTVTNTAPVANAGADQVVTPEAIVQLDGSRSSDTDGHGLDYGWQQTGGKAVALSNAALSRTNFVASPAGVFTFSLVVTDDFGLASQRDEVAINVEHRSYLPIAMRLFRYPP